MQRRDVLRILALAALTAPALRVQEAAAAIKFDPKAPKPTFVMLVHPDMVLLDLVPALTAFKLTMGDVQLVWKDRNLVSTDVGVDVRPTATLAEAHLAPDVLYIPGGIRGTVACMQDPEVIAFVEKTGASARFVTSACTGSLLLGAAGLLKGYPRHRPLAVPACAAASRRHSRRRARGA